MLVDMDEIEAVEDETMDGSRIAAGVSTLRQQRLITRNGVEIEIVQAAAGRLGTGRSKSR